MRRRHYRDYDKRDLRLDTAHKKIGGVCAGLANYFGWSSCTVRVLSIVCLFVMPQVILPAYFLAYLIMDKDEQWEDVY
ncbi:MAG: phage shock protein PspC (stress-responsive transcriptional regulator) [Candidatus Azotimanducaceae bacterium]|jgi:phage shock protein C